MLDLRNIVEQPDEYINKIKTRNISNVSEIIEKLVIKHAQFLELIKRQQERFRLIKERSKNFNTLSTSEKKAILIDAKKLDELQKIDDENFEKIKNETNQLTSLLPNIPLPDVPIGKNENDNVTLRENGTKAVTGYAKDYLVLAEELGIVDMTRGAKVSGSRFGYLKGAGALLEFALVQYAMQELTRAGFTAMVPPVIINEPYMEAMGYLAQGGIDEVYHLEKDSQYLVGTSEQAIGPYHADEILPEGELPKKYAAFSTCFRREAGSYGKDTKGILRVHQFDKVEMFMISTPENSESAHQELLAIQERLVQGLGLPYRVVQLCTGDLGFPSAKTYDIECWLPGQNDGKGEYRETHSTSNTTDYQARALNIRIKGKDGKNIVAHMLNGTAFAIGRTIIAILENHQTPDGSVLVPKVLQPFMHGITEIRKS